MKMSRLLVCCFVLSLSLGFDGCSSGINVTHVDVGDSPLKGNPWNLPMTQFTITITRHVVECGRNLKGTVEVIATPTMVIDEQQRYVLESNGWWATSDITSNLAPSGISTGLNAQSTDATAAIISNIVGTVGQVAIAAVSKEADVCELGVSQAVGRLRDLKAKVDKETAALAATTARVTLLTAQAQLDSSYKKALVIALEEQDKAKSQLNSDQTKLAADLKLTSDTQVVHWPLIASEFRRDRPYVLDKEVLSRWVADESIINKADKQFSVYLALYRQTSKDGSWVKPSPPAFSDVKVGVPIRLARTGRLLICRMDKCPETLPESGSNNPNYNSFDQVVLQMGQLYTVPLTGGTFKSETAVIAVDTNGLPTLIQVSEKVAQGAALTGTTKDVSTQLAALPGQVRAAELARTQSETSQLTAQSALIAAQANAGVAGQTSALAAQTALINAQTALATAQNNAGIPIQTAGLTAQTALLNAQAALATAQANVGIVDTTSGLAAQTTLLNAQTAQINAATAAAAALVKANTAVK